MFWAMRAALLLLLMVSPVAAEDRLSPADPPFSQFEANCRDGEGMIEECQAGVLGAYAIFAGTESIRCDFALFWRVRDEQMNDLEGFSALPWQNGLAKILAVDGVCTH